MTIFNLGSINADILYRVPHLPVAGETLAATDRVVGLGGKGTNMSVAIARAAARVVHIGAVGQDGIWARDRLLEYGVDTRHIALVDVPTGHAVIAVEDSGENSILLFPGANNAISTAQIKAAFSEANADDVFLTQNETTCQQEAVKMASELGMRVAYAAAPFDAQSVQAILPLLDVLFLNAVEAEQLTAATGLAPEALPVRDVIVTLGGDGARWINTDTGASTHIPPVPTEVVDTTGAGDTFTGYTLAGLDRGLPMEQALRQASLAASIMVSRQGTADVIPDLKDLEDARL